jgi:hypothetical protein
MKKDVHIVRMCPIWIKMFWLEDGNTSSIQAYNIVHLY